ncbi:MAG: hypothetical protein A2X32_11010 [Elusimicrobia bacterium GWC2_64_44]|nr:MAG: hypothetical protein A2X32_11010 [Elusimicrobia bacterium GWC2_64_44]
MTGRLLLKVLLFGFIAAGVGSMLHKSALSRAAALKARPAAAAAHAAPVKASAGVSQNTAVVYYFYTNTRCASCTQLEAYTREAVETLLSAGYKGWRVEFKGVNVEEPGNEHFTQDYRLESKAVIVQKFSGGKPLDWVKLDKVWILLGDNAAFVNYVAAETRQALDKK